MVALAFIVVGAFRLVQRDASEEGQQEQEHSLSGRTLDGGQEAAKQVDGHEDGTGDRRHSTPFKSCCRCWCWTIFCPMTRFKFSRRSGCSSGLPQPPDQGMNPDEYSNSSRIHLASGQQPQFPFPSPEEPPRPGYPTTLHDVGPKVYVAGCRQMAPLYGGPSNCPGFPRGSPGPEAPLPFSTLSLSSSSSSSLSRACSDTSSRSDFEMCEDYCCPYYCNSSMAPSCTHPDQSSINDGGFFASAEVAPNPSNRYRSNYPKRWNVRMDNLERIEEAESGLENTLPWHCTLPK